MIRIVVAAVVGGLLMITAGYITHEQLHLVERQLRAPDQQSTAAQALQTHFPEPGIYYYPPMPKDADKMNEDDKKKFQETMSENYKNGPNAIVVMAPTGMEFNMLRLIGFEAATNFGACLLAAFIIAMTRPSIGFAGRWIAVFFIGVASWLSVNASYYIWWRFPYPWVMDELYAAMLEWGLAAIAIAALVRPQADSTRP